MVRYRMFVCSHCAALYGASGVCQRDGTTLLDAANDALLGTMVGNYRIAAPIGAGGMGTVYRAVQPEIGSVVAVKVLSQQSASDSDTVQRFFDEARSVNVIRHQNIVNIMDLARLPDGRPYIIMEYLDGHSLKTQLRHGPLAIDEAARISLAVLDALAAAHARGVQHRDLKPDNIMLAPSGRITLVDFGIAKFATANPNAARTETGAILGTPHYMAPEQAQGRPIDGRTDIYAMGVVIYEMITGVRPFTGDSLFDILRQHVSDPPLPPSQRGVPHLSADFEQVIMVALAKAPDQRFASATAMQSAIRHCISTTAQQRPSQPAFVVGATPPSAHASSASMIASSGYRTTNRSLRAKLAIAAVAGVAIVIPLVLLQSRSASDTSTAAGKPTSTSATTAQATPTPPPLPPPVTRPTPVADAADPQGPASAAVANALIQISSREEMLIARNSKDPVIAAAAYEVCKEFEDQQPPFIANGAKQEIVVDDFVAYAEAKARSLEADAVLVTVEYRGLTKAGTISPNIFYGAASATFFSPHRFVRPARIAADEDWTPLAAIDVKIDNFGVRYQRGWDTWKEKPALVPAPRCKPAQLWAKMHAAGARGEHADPIIYEEGRWRVVFGGITFKDDCQ